jgi:HEAT repeat protein
MPENSSIPVAAASPASAALDHAVAALSAYKPGSPRSLLVPIDEAVVASLAEPSVRSQLEQRLAALLPGQLSNVAKEYICAKLGLIGSPASVSALAQLLGDKDLAHSARAALEAIPCREAVDALLGALPRTSGMNRIGIINSLRARRDPRGVSDLSRLLGDSDPQVASAAAAALGQIGTSAAANALEKVRSNAPEPVQQSVADARLVCAERLLQSGHKPEALAIYKALAEPQQPKPIQLAAKRGLLLVLQSK